MKTMKFKILSRRQVKNNRHQRKCSGFTILESLIAGILVASIMTAVGRLGVASIATSRLQSSRKAIEGAINNHIQRVQMQDSYLTQDTIEKGAIENLDWIKACQNPSKILKEHLKKPEIAGITASSSVTIDWDDSDPYLLILTYSFEAPESKISSEKRIIEINPNFSSKCYDI